jgi:anti-sigma B factor antagonist
MKRPTRSLRVETVTVNGRPVIRVRGDVNLDTSPQLRELLLELSKKASGSLLIDLSQVPFMDSSGAGTMVFVKRELEREGRSMILIGLQPRVRSVFEITRLDQFFRIRSSVEEATGA